MKASDVANFVLEHGEGIYSYSDYPYIVKYIELHFHYGTIMVLRHEGKIIAVCRWNQPTATHAHIEDFVVHPDYRNKNLARDMFIRAKKAMPNLVTISFERGKKYPGRAIRTYFLDDLIGDINVKKSFANNH